MHEGLPVVEIVNNWVCASFEDTYRPPLIGEQIAHVLDAVQPDVVHVHNLLNLSFDLPALAQRARHPGRRDAARLHAGLCLGRPARASRRAARLPTIDADRCARCFRESPFHAQMSFGAVSAATGALVAGAPAAAALKRRRARTGRAGWRARRATSTAVAGHARTTSTSGWRARARSSTTSICSSRRRSRSPSEFCRSGVDRSKSGSPTTASLRVDRAADAPVADPSAPLRFGFVGTLVWHKGVHVLLDAVRALPAATPAS